MFGSTDLAAKHKTGVMFVLFDSVWDPYPKAGKQRDPFPHRHNSGWVQSPGQDILQDPARQDELKAYVQDVIGHFRNDRRVQVWDLFNRKEVDYIRSLTRPQSQTRKRVWDPG